MTIHPRRGSGTWWAWLWIGFILAVAVAAIVYGLA